MRHPQESKLADAHRIDGEQRDSDREEPPDLTGCGGERGDEPTPVARRAFEQIGDDRDVLAADRKSHDAAEEKKKPASRRAHLSVRGEKRGAEHRHRHQRHGQQHCPPPPEPIPDMAEDKAAERTQQIGDCKRGQSDAQRGFAGAKKDPRKHGGEVEVEGEVVPFHHRREGRDGDRGARHGFLRRLRVGHSWRQLSVNRMSVCPQKACLHSAKAGPISRPSRRPASRPVRKRVRGREERARSGGDHESWRAGGRASTLSR